MIGNRTAWEIGKFDEINDVSVPSCPLGFANLFLSVIARNEAISDVCIQDILRFTNFWPILHCKGYPSTIFLKRFGLQRVQIASQLRFAMTD